MDPRDPVFTAVFAVEVFLMFVCVLLALWTGHVAWVAVLLPAVMCDLSIAASYHRGKGVFETQPERRRFILFGSGVSHLILAVDVWFTGLGPWDFLFWMPLLMVILVLVVDAVLTRRIVGES